MSDTGGSGSNASSNTVATSPQRGKTRNNAHRNRSDIWWKHGTHVQGNGKEKNVNIAQGL